MTNTIYLDMDGVVADFNSYAETVLKKTDTGHKWTPDEWTRLKDNPHLYRDLKKMPLADDLTQIARKFRDNLNWNLYFLTAVPKDNDVPWAFYDKVKWAENYYPDIPVHFGPYAVDKAKHCQPGDILIDDRETTCNQWQQAGGKTIYVIRRQYTQAIEELKHLFENIAIDTV
jgi:5'(3')-deoxyribonucleotidase